MVEIVILELIGWHNK